MPSGTFSSLIYGLPRNDGTTSKMKIGTAKEILYTNMYFKIDKPKPLGNLKNNGGKNNLG